MLAEGLRKGWENLWSIEKHPQDKKWVFLRLSRVFWGFTLYLQKNDFNTLRKKLIPWESCVRTLENFLRVFWRSTLRILNPLETVSQGWESWEIFSGFLKILNFLKLRFGGCSCDASYEMFAVHVIARPESRFFDPSGPTDAKKLW